MPAKLMQAPQAGDESHRLAAAVFLRTTLARARGAAATERTHEQWPHVQVGALHRGQMGSVGVSGAPQPDA
jgi:hypothetical protein